MSKMGFDTIYHEVAICSGGRWCLVSQDVCGIVV